MISISGMRGVVGHDLTPELVACHAAALGAWAREAARPLVVIGRDSRTSGPMFAHAATAGLLSVGCDVVDLGVVATPTTQLAVEHHRAGAGLMLSASHNPVEWNALKLIGPDGLFLDAAAGARVRALAETGPPRVGWDGIGTRREDSDATTRHQDQVLALRWIDTDAIRQRGFRVALDCVRGAGGKVIPALLQRLGCTVTGIHLEADGRFPRNPEPIPEHLAELGDLVRRSGSNLGMAVDPDVDRLALVDETGRPIGEDYTLAFAVRAVLAALGPTTRADRPAVVINLSTSLVVEDAARAFGARVVRVPVGEAHVARAIRAEKAVIGGEGNGGVILPELHFGRDALAGVALVLRYLSGQEMPLSGVVRAAPRYSILKARAPRRSNLAEAYRRLRDRFRDAVADERDGLRLAWENRWVHVRPSGTEPVVRIIAEAPDQAGAETLIAACRDLIE
jgi:phosphomannomutase